MRKIETIVFLLTLTYFSITYGMQGNCKETEYQCRNNNRNLDEDGGYWGSNIRCEPLSERNVDLEPNELVYCRVNCTENNYWCEPRGKCISKREVCDCGKDKIKCVSDREYVCEETKNFNTTPIFELCTDGTCKVKGICDKEYKECKPGTFMCGTECREKVDVTKFRSCEGKCIPVGQTCYKDEGEKAPPPFLEKIRRQLGQLGLEETEMIGVAVGSGAGIVLFIGTGVLCVVLCVIYRKKKKRMTRRETMTMDNDSQEMALGEIVGINQANGFAGALNEIRDGNQGNGILQIPVEPAGASNAINVTGSQLSAEGDIIVQSSQDTYNNINNNTNNISNMLTNNTFINVNVSREDLSQLLRSMNQSMNSSDQSEAVGQQNHPAIL